MTPIEWLFNARREFDSNWRAHVVSMRSMQLLRNGGGLDDALQVVPAMRKGFSHEFDSFDDLEDLREELEWLKDEDFEPLRRNCLLGVCAGFENCVKLAAAAISFGPNWKLDIDHRALLDQECDDEFDRRFAAVDKEWSGSQQTFLLAKLPHLQSKRSLVSRAIEAIWVRNQHTHNAGRAKSDRELPELKLSVQVGDQIKLTRSLIASCVSAMVGCGRAVFKEAPYLEAL